MVDISFRMKYTNEPCSSIYESIKDRIPVTLNAIKNIKQRKRYLKYTDCVEFELSDVVIRCLDFAGLRSISLCSVVTTDHEFKDYWANMPFFKFAYDSCCFLINDCAEDAVKTTISSVYRYCRHHGIDLDFFIRTKMNYNRLRGYHHGGKRY